VTLTHGNAPPAAQEHYALELAHGALRRSEAARAALQKELDAKKASEEAMA
jgi:hypothetical protein